MAYWRGAANNITVHYFCCFRCIRARGKSKVGRCIRWRLILVDKPQFVCFIYLLLLLVRTNVLTTTDFLYFDVDEPWRRVCRTDRRRSLAAAVDEWQTDAVVSTSSSDPSPPASATATTVLRSSARGQSRSIIRWRSVLEPDKWTRALKDRPPATAS